MNLRLMSDLANQLHHTLLQYQRVVEHCLDRRDFAQATAYSAKICSVLDNLDPAKATELAANGFELPFNRQPDRTNNKAKASVETLPISSLDLTLVNDQSLHTISSLTRTTTKSTNLASVDQRRPWWLLRGVAYWNLGDCYQRSGQSIPAETAFEQSSNWFYQAGAKEHNIKALERLIDVVEQLGKHQLATNLQRRIQKMNALKKP
ncbi:hypothetical protein IWQ62_003274 [Dispira parvispora]|uniref:Tetratricopeptide repeat protein n=1 Tax=Dispira parvispora TaxID=1520584 RepID=A0A9W8AUH2_9FUNG|nr:hypothetical protein IWQ62_003274 [Dispira parvispora]